MEERDWGKLKMRMRNGKVAPQLFFISGLESENRKTSSARKSSGEEAPNTQKWKMRMGKTKKQAAKRTLTHMGCGAHPLRPTTPHVSEGVVGSGTNGVYLS